jgi:biopolymer transport protein ExbB/TolQ
MTDYEAIITQVYSIIWTDNLLPGRILTVLIGALGLLALVLVLRHSIRYNKEERALDDAESNLPLLQKEAAGKPSPSADESSNSGESSEAHDDCTPAAVTARQHLVDLGKLKHRLNSNTMVWARINSIETLRARRVRVNTETLQQLSLAMDDAQPGLGWPAFIANAALVLGILGTFIGLWLMVQDIQELLPNHVDNDVIAALASTIDRLRIVLSGMKVAFSTTLVGMACSLIISFSAFYLDRRRSGFFERFERFTTEQLLPAAVPAVDDENMLDQVSHKLDDSLEQLLEGLRCENVDRGHGPSLVTQPGDARKAR